MALTNQSEALRNAKAAAFSARLDDGTTNAKGALQILTSGGTVLATVPLASSDFSAPSAGSVTASTIPPVTADNPGTANVMRYVDRDATTIVEGTVGTSGADLNLDNINITAGQSIDISTLTYNG